VPPKWKITARNTRRLPGLHVLFDASRVRALADSLGDELKGLK
jgi:hypothetical protein